MRINISPPTNTKLIPVNLYVGRGLTQIYNFGENQYLTTHKYIIVASTAQGKGPIKILREACKNGKGGGVIWGKDCFEDVKGIWKWPETIYNAVWYKVYFRFQIEYSSFWVIEGYKPYWAKLVALCVVGRVFHRLYCKCLSIVTNFGS